MRLCCHIVIYGVPKPMIFFRKHTNSGLACAIIAVLFVTLALAHHPLGGNAPQTIWPWFLCGLVYPIIGFDHLNFFIASGVIIKFLKNRLMAGVLLVVATTSGILNLLAVVRMGVIYCTVFVLRALLKATETKALKLRLLGALAGGGCLVYLHEHGEGMIV